MIMQIEGCKCIVSTTCVCLCIKTMLALWGKEILFRVWLDLPLDRILKRGMI